MAQDPSGSQGQEASSDNMGNSNFDFNAYNLQQALAQQLQGFADSSNQNSNLRGGESIKSPQGSGNAKGNSSMSPDALSAFVANNITTQDLMAGQMSNGHGGGEGAQNNNQQNRNFPVDFNLQGGDGQQLSNMDILSPEYWAAFEQNSQYQPMDMGNMDGMNGHPNQQDLNNFMNQGQNGQGDLPHDAQRLFRQLQAGLKANLQGQNSAWPNGGQNAQYMNGPEQQRGRQPNMAAARNIPNQQTLAQCLLPSFSPLDKGVSNFDFDFSRLDMAGHRLANPIGDANLASASATATAAVMNMDLNYGNSNGMNGINPSFVDPSATFNPAMMNASVFSHLKDHQGGFARGGNLESVGTPRTSSMLSTRSPSIGSGKDVDMQTPSGLSQTDGKGNTGGQALTAAALNPSHLQRARSPSATRAGNGKSSARRSTSNTRPRVGSNDGIGPARRPSFNSHTVARTSAMQGSYPHPHQPPAAAPAVGSGRPQHKRSTSSTNQIQTLASGVNTLGIEKDAEWRHLAGMGAISVTSPKSAYAATFNPSDGGLSHSPVSTDSPTSTVLKSPASGKPRRLSTTETSSSRPNMRRKSSTSRTRRDTRTVIAVKKEDLFDADDSALVEANDIAVSDGEHDEAIE
jgi:hypothetical protein